MTPKQKAIELVNKMAFEVCKTDAKQCAFIAVDEILEATKKYDYTLGPNPSFNHYWLNVKKEMDKL
jgi:uncharacterized ferredoxin-like protein